MRFVGKCMRVGIAEEKFNLQYDEAFLNWRTCFVNFGKAILARRPHGETTTEVRRSQRSARRRRRKGHGQSKVRRRHRRSRHALWQNFAQRLSACADPLG